MNPLNIGLYIDLGARARTRSTRRGRRSFGEVSEWCLAVSRFQTCSTACCVLRLNMCNELYTFLFETFDTYNTSDDVFWTSNMLNDIRLVVRGL